MTNSGGRVITLSGFAADNPLRTLGDINIWLNSKNYGLVEIGHQFILHNLSDRFGAGHTEA
jgi:D-sedoheptulose 7-phosphate isomerase